MTSNTDIASGLSPHLPSPWLPEVVLRVLWGSSDHGKPLVPRSPEELDYVIDARVGRCILRRVAMVGDQHPLTNLSLNFHVCYQQHDAIEEQGFTLGRKRGEETLSSTFYRIIQKPFPLTTHQWVWLSGHMTSQWVWLSGHMTN